MPALDLIPRVDATVWQVLDPKQKVNILISQVGALLMQALDLMLRADALARQVQDPTQKANVTAWLVEGQTEAMKDQQIYRG